MKIQTVCDALQLSRLTISNLYCMSSPWTMPQLESNFLQTLFFSFLAFFLLSALIQLQQYYTLGV